MKGRRFFTVAREPVTATLSDLGNPSLAEDGCFQLAIDIHIGLDERRKNVCHETFTVISHWRLECLLGSTVDALSDAFRLIT